MTTLERCVLCGKTLHRETFDGQDFLVDDETGGDVCGALGGNEPHESTLRKHYIVVWSGGYEAPSYVFKATRPEAWEQAEEWVSDMREADTIDVLEVDTVAQTVTRIEVE